MPIDACLVDTNVLLRIPKLSDPNHLAVDNALAKLATQGTTLYYTHQNIAEFWNTITRPLSERVWPDSSGRGPRGCADRIRNGAIAR
jgi:hypothetical protein